MKNLGKVVLAGAAFALGLGSAGAASAAGPVEMNLEFHPKVAAIGQAVVISVASANVGPTPVDATIRLSLEVSGLSYSVSETFAMDAGERSCAELTLNPILPGIIRITAQSNVVEVVSRDSDTLYVLPGGSNSPFDDLPALGESILSSFTSCSPTPVERATWGRIKTRYR